MADKMTGKKPKKVHAKLTAADAEPKGITGSLPKKELEHRKKK